LGGLPFDGLAIGGAVVPFVNKGWRVSGAGSVGDRCVLEASLNVLKAWPAGRS